MSEVSEEEKVPEEERVVSQLSDQLRASRSSIRNLAQQKSDLIYKVNEYDRAYKQLLSGQAKQQYDTRDQQLTELSQRLRERHQSKNTVNKQREEGAKEIENGLIEHLDAVVERIKSEGSKDISLLQRKYDKEIEHTIRASITSAWIVGANYTGMRKNRLHHTFITVSDIENIKSLVSEFTYTFWRRMNLFLHQEDIIRQQKIKVGRFSPNSKFNINALVTSLAVNAVTKTIAKATISKLKGLKR